MERRKRYAWTEEGVARAQYWYSKVLSKLGKDEDAQKQMVQALTTKRRFLENYPKFLKDDPDDQVVLDRMNSIEAGRLTGRLKQPNGPKHDV